MALRFLLLKLFISAAAILLAALFLDGIKVKGAFSATAAAFILGIVNLLIKPFLIFMTLPINLLSFGIFTFFINGFLLFITSWFVPGFSVDGMFTAIKGSIIISISSFILKFLLLPGFSIYIF